MSFSGKRYRFDPRRHIDCDTPLFGRERRAEIKGKLRGLGPLPGPHPGEKKRLEEPAIAAQRRGEIPANERNFSTICFGCSRTLQAQAPTNAAGGRSDATLS